MLLFDMPYKKESWIYGSGGKTSVISDEMLPPINDFIHAEVMLTGWEARNTVDCHSLTQILSPDLAKDQGPMELRFHATSKAVSTEKPMGSSVYENVSHGRMVTSCSFSQRAPFQKHGSGSITDTSEHDSSFIDLKLGRVIDFKAVKNNKCPKDSRGSSATSAVPAKKIRSTCLNGQNPFCQVYGCNMDLRSSKDYHKRHKVCEIHSKTAKVIVNGVEQRFCQQCSRFHLLAEFDDGKRSCRKRLAGHNERRRKPRLDVHSRSGGNFVDTSLPVMASFFCSNIFPSGIVHEGRYGNGEISSASQSYMSSATGQLFPKSFLPYHNTDKHISSIYNVGNTSGNMFYGHMNQTEQHAVSSNLFSGHGSDIQDFSVVTVACCAPSLLSSPSQSASSYSSTAPIAQPLSFQSGQAHYSATQFPKKPLGVVSHASTIMASDSLSLSEMNSTGDEERGLLLSSVSNTLEFKVQTDVVYQDPELVSKELLSLSILLQSAEQNSLGQAKEESEIFSCPPITEVD